MNNSGPRATASKTSVKMGDQQSFTKEESLLFTENPQEDTSPSPEAINIMITEAVSGSIDIQKA